MAVRFYHVDSIVGVENMSDVNAAILTWRQKLEEIGGMSPMVVAELEAHLVRDMDTLQKSGLRPDEAFVISTRRLGHPLAPVSEPPLPRRIVSWARPAKFWLWGLLLCEILAVASVTLVNILARVGLWEQIGSPWLSARWSVYLIDGTALWLLWCVLQKPRHPVTRGLARMEAAIASRAGAIGLILGVTLLVVAHLAVRLWLQSFLDSLPLPDVTVADGETALEQATSLPPAAVQTAPASDAAIAEPSYYNPAMLAQLLVPRIAWMVAIALLLIAIVRAERRPSTA